MARKTFISYKYSEAQVLRDRIIKALGNDATYYKGETSDSPDKTDTSTENIKNILKNKIYDTSVTIVIISPNIKLSNWIDWEIEYSLKEITRQDKTSRTNGIVGVIQKVNGNYSWLQTTVSKLDGHSCTSTDWNKLYNIIRDNYANQNPLEYFCEECGTINTLSSSYFSLIDEDSFINNPQKYIENAYEKSQNIKNYKISKTR